MMSVFVIEVSEDGDIQIRQMTRGEFAKALNTSPEDDCALGILPIDPKSVRDELGGSDPMLWGSGGGGRVLAIEGAIVFPILVTQLTKWELSGVGK